jgi:hypothetical protein
MNNDWWLAFPSLAVIVPMLVKQWRFNKWLDRNEH